MSKEETKIEELPVSGKDQKAPADKKEGEKKENDNPNSSVPVSLGNPWIPILVILILLPVLSFAMMKFILFPHIKKVIQETVQVENIPGNSSSDAQVHKKGESHDAQKISSVKFDNIISNLAGSLNRYIKVSFILEGEGTDFSSVAETNRIQLTDATLGVLSILAVKDFESPGIKNIVRRDLIQSLQSVLKNNKIKELFFSEFVVR